jgi:predicted transcriptional regulator
MAAAAVNEEMVQKLQQLEETRQQLEALDQAVALLSPADKLIYQKLILSPQRGNTELLCQLLEKEKSTLYRRRARLLQRLSAYLTPPHP